MLLLLGPATAVAFELSTVSIDGNIGYNHRILSGASENDAVSNQLLGILNTSTYIWRPWLATTALGVTYTADTSELQGGGNKTEARIMTGDLDLNIFPRSNTPFTFSYQVSDSRVENIMVSNRLVPVTRENFNTRQLALSQSYLTDGGNRILVRYDKYQWSAKQVNNFDDEKFSIDLDFRPRNRHLITRISKQKTINSIASKRADNTRIHINDMYFPMKDFRVDSMLSFYRSDQTLNNATNQITSGKTQSDLIQLSSFAFWRPDQEPFTVSGGLRISGLQSDSATVSSEKRTVNATLGGFYYYSQGLRFEGNVSITQLDSNGDKELTTSGRLGTNYNSNLTQIFGYKYQWFGGASVSHRRDDLNGSLISVVGDLGHTVQRSWLTVNSALFRISVHQGFRELLKNKGSSNSTLTHTGNAAWSLTQGIMTSMLQMTLTDSRNLGVMGDSQQLANFQAIGNLVLGNGRSLGGNFTLQVVRGSFAGQSSASTIKTVTGNVRYHHSRILGVPRLLYTSRLRKSIADTDGGGDIFDWENRLEYGIGLLKTTLSVNFIDNGTQDYSLIFFRITRRI